MNILKDKSFNFALRVVKMYKFLSIEKKEFVLSKQLLRSGTSVGVMVREAQNAESKLDFHKLGIAQKECDETLYWLELLYKSDFMMEVEFQELQDEASQILRIIKSSILTVKQNLKKPK